MTTNGINNMYLTEEDLAEETDGGVGDGQRKHDAGTTDHRGRGREDWRSTRTPRKVQRQR